MSRRTITYILAVIMAFVNLASCQKRDTKLTMSAISDRTTAPVLDAEQVTTLISDSGVTRFRITSRSWQIYDKADPAYWEFPKGIYLEQFDMNLQTVASLQADYAHYNEKDEIWHLVGNVHALNAQGEMFDTEELFWNQQTEKVYSDAEIEITQEKSVIKGIGFESNQEMTKYTIRKPTGMFPIDDEQDDRQ